jgi:hypothetical protein
MFAEVMFYMFVHRDTWYLQREAVCRNNAVIWARVGFQHISQVGY